MLHNIVKLPSCTDHCHLIKKIRAFLLRSLILSSLMCRLVAVFFLGLTTKLFLKIFCCHWLVLFIVLSAFLCRSDAMEPCNEVMPPYMWLPYMLVRCARPPADFYQYVTASQKNRFFTPSLIFLRWPPNYSALQLYVTITVIARFFCRDWRLHVDLASGSSWSRWAFYFSFYIWIRSRFHAAIFSFFSMSTFPVAHRAA